MLESGVWPGLVRPPPRLGPLPWQSPFTGTEHLSMSEHERTTTIPAESQDGNGTNVVPFPPTRTRTRRRPRIRLWRRGKQPKRFRIRKLRVLLLLFGIAVLAAVSPAFGMFMAIVRALPGLEEPPHPPSMLYDRHDVPIGTLTGNERRIYLSETQIAPVMK